MKINNVAVGIPVSNLEISAKWYKEIFQPEEEIVVSDEMTEYKIGQIWVQLFEEKVRECENILNFSVENIKREYDRLKEMSVIQNEQIEDVPEVVKFFVFKDPDGNKLSFVEEY